MVLVVLTLLTITAEKSEISENLNMIEGGQGGDDDEKQQQKLCYITFIAN